MPADRRSHSFRSAGALLLVGASLTAAAGCQQRPTTVSGTVTLDGRPLNVASDARGTVVFQPNGGLGTVATGLIDTRGHFDLATGSSKEIAPGDYYVTVSVAKLLPKSDQGEQGSLLVTPAKYSSARDSGLVAKVQPGENHLKFELSSSEDSGGSNAPSSPSDKSQTTGTTTSKDSTDKN
jgi:hypothetical protein